MVYRTTEARWFFEGCLPDHVRLWFMKNQTLSPEVAERRVDLYLRLPGVESLGVKLREGLLQLKRRREALFETEVVTALAGKLELWTKWSSPASGDELGASKDVENWLPVGKTRAMHRFSEEPGAGCDCELTELDVRERRFWTLGFEAYGAADRQLPALLQATAEIFRDGIPGSIERSRSMGYPEWLNRQVW